MSVFGVILVHIFPHSDWIRRDPSSKSKCGKIRTRITPNTETFHAVSMLTLSVIHVNTVCYPLKRHANKTCSWMLQVCLRSYFFLIVRNCLFLRASSFALALLWFELSILELLITFITKKSKYSSKFGSVLQWCLVPILLLFKI